MEDQDGIWKTVLQTQNQCNQKDLKFTKKQVITFKDMFTQQLKQLLTPKFMQQKKVQLKTYHFIISIKNPYKQWIIIKTLSDFLTIQKQCKIKLRQKIPSIPTRLQQQINDTNKLTLLTYFQLFLNILGQNKKISSHKYFMKFINNLGPPQRKKLKIYFQIELSKRPGGRHTQSLFKKFANYIISWERKFFTITTEGIYYTANQTDYRIQEMIPFTVGFHFLYGLAQTGYQFGVALNSVQRLLYIDTHNIYNMVYFIYFIKKAMMQSNYLKQNRYHSFASQRINCNSNYYIDGKQYFSDLYDAFLSAKHQIFITGWMISPFFYLKRNPRNEKYRFDKVIQQVSNMGVKIHIIIYMQPKLALNLDSQFTQNYLNQLSPNIKVIRHPPYLLIPFLWTHHQKIVIIDQKIAFIGGLDIGYGRYDDNTHQLSDLKQQHWPGVDYCNYRKTDILKPQQYNTCTIKRQSQPRMPWHDVAVRIWGQSVIDLSRHFAQYWNYVNIQLSMDQRQLLLSAGIDQNNINQLQIKKNNNSCQKQMNTMIDKMHKKSHQSNPIYYQCQTSQTPQNFYKAKIFAISQISQQQIIAHQKQQRQFYAQHMQKQSKIDHFLHRFKQKKNHFSVFNRQGINFQSLIITQPQHPNHQNFSTLGKQKHQILRSASQWSLGLSAGHNQRSILQAYQQLIYNSKQFIYIQNQFFISVENTVTKALIQRIKRAYLNKQQFKVLVVIPALPGFAGEINQQDSAVLRIQVHYNYQTICRGDKSLYSMLKDVPNIDDYIQFFTLRTHDVINDTPVTQMIYVHSKLIIVDDLKVLIGSANINDRSLLGSRDSQIAVVIQDQQYIEIQINNKTQMRKVSKFAHNLRVDLCMQHFEVNRQQIQDYHNEDTWCKIFQHADKNQQIYRQIFGIYPDSIIPTFAQIKKVYEKGDKKKYKLMKQIIKGHALIFQRQFLCDQDITLKVNQKQYYAPAINFT